LDLRDQFVRFLATPVELHPEWHHDQGLCQAIERSASGKRAFPIIALGKKEARLRYDSVRLNGSKPSTTADWIKVLEYGEAKRKSRELLARWNNLHHHFGAPVVSEDPERTFPQLVIHAELVLQVRVLAVNYNLTFKDRLLAVFPNLDGGEVQTTESYLERLENNLRMQLRKHELAAAGVKVTRLKALLRGVPGDLFLRMRDFLDSSLGNRNYSVTECERQWEGLLGELSDLRAKDAVIVIVRSVTDLIARCGGVEWARQLRQQHVLNDVDALIPGDWRDAWTWSRRRGFLESIDGRTDIVRLTRDRSDAEKSLASEYENTIEKRTWLGLVGSLNDRVSRAIVAYVQAIGAMTRTGMGRRDPQLRRAAREAMVDASRGVPCWIMPQWRISEALPPHLGVFDLVIIDEASQSDAWAVPALLRGKKVLIVGDDKQVGPNPSFTSQAQVDHLMAHLREADIPTAIWTCLDPKQSIYDLGEVVFAGQTIRLREHFRCAEPIIEFSNRLCYNGEIRCVRVPTASERLLPTLVDVHVKSGYRDPRRKVNKPEAGAIVDEIEILTKDPIYAGRSIGVVSLLGIDQAREIQEALIERIGEQAFLKHEIRCGDARTFQGSERDIIFISAVDDSTSGSPLTENKDDNVRRINVAVSRARDRLYFYHSFSRDSLRPFDLRAKLLDHFRAPLPSQGNAKGRELCESDFEREMYDSLVGFGYRVIPQVPVGGYRIDLVVEGGDGRRLAVECDGDRYHGPDRWMEDMRRQRNIERAGWKFWRCWGSSFARDQEGCLKDLVATLAGEGITPIKGDAVDFSGLVDFRVITSEEEPALFLVDDEEGREEEQRDPDDQSEVLIEVAPSVEEDDLRDGTGKTIHPQGATARAEAPANPVRPAPLRTDLFEGDLSDLELFQLRPKPPLPTASVDPAPQLTGPKVSVGDVVKFYYHNDREKEIVCLIIDGPSNPEIGHMNSKTVVARALLGARAGQDCKIQLPDEERIATIVSIENRI